jgi:hypothetical protein
MQTMKEPSRLAMCAAGRIVDMCERAFGVELPCAERGDELQRQFAEAIDAALNASPQITDETEQRATVVVGQRAHDVPKEVGAALMQARAALRMVNDDYDDTGCDGMGTISSETIEHVRRVIGQ